MLVVCWHGGDSVNGCCSGDGDCGGGGGGGGSDR